MRLTVAGCSPAWPNPGGAQSGYLVEANATSLLLDCGAGVLANLRRHYGGWPAVDSIVVTHWHLDHWGDIVPWVWGNMVGPGRGHRQPELWLPPQGRERLRQLGSMLGWDEMFAQTFELRDYVETDPFHTRGGLELRATRLPHYTLLTFGLRITDGERVLAYSGDSGPDHRLAELARNADLFLCEATLERGELDGFPRGHLSADEAIAAFQDSGAKRLLLTHRPAELALPDGLEQTHDGLVVEF